MLLSIMIEGNSAIENKIQFMRGAWHVKRFDWLSNGEMQGTIVCNDVWSFNPSSIFCIKRLCAKLRSTCFLLNQKLLLIKDKKDSQASKLPELVWEGR